MKLEILRSHGIDALVVIRGAVLIWEQKLLTERHSQFPLSVFLEQLIMMLLALIILSVIKPHLKPPVEAIDRLRDTSSSHKRISIVEIMGRHCSDLTISAAIAGGCEYIVLLKLNLIVKN